MQMLLHHYPMSPYSEKIRLMFGYTGTAWRGVISPEMPPRPNLDPVLAGYRKIPVAQDGADFYCDTRLISAELAARCGRPELDPAQCDEAALGLEAGLEHEVFWACVTSLPASQVLKQLVRNISIIGAYRFIKDRAGVARKAASKPVPPKEAPVLFRRHLEGLERILSKGADFLGGAAPNHLDFAAYHTLWFQRVVGERPEPDGVPAVLAWYARMGAFGHGEQREVSGENAFQAIRDSKPLPVSPERAAHDQVGQRVRIGPDDYAMDVTEGVLVGADAQRWIIARQTDYGTVHIHFPSDGFVLSLA
jgi:glutathione S-transferase